MQRDIPENEMTDRQDEGMPDRTDEPREMPSIEEDPTELPQEQPDEQPGESVETPDPVEVERPSGLDGGAMTLGDVGGG
jgi:outer membrane biosynthesis protein TonB